MLHAIRENKVRARFLGYDVNKYRVNAFVLSALFPAVAGWQFTPYRNAKGQPIQKNVILPLQLVDGKF